MKRAAVVLMALLLLVSAAACADDGTDDATDEGTDEGTGEAVLPFTDVQASDFEFEADPNDPRRGIFRVTTTEPMICAIVWGETDAYGRFNNSLAMNGTGIEQHDVVLPDVESDREYHFVVQGTTADGRLYRSEPGTFTIELVEPAGGEPDDRDNLALQATIGDVSSEFSDAFGAANAIDGDLDTEWSTSGDGDDAYITVDLGRAQEIGAVEFVTRSMADGTAITTTFTVTVDGAEPQGPFPASTPAQSRVSPLIATGQQLRFDIAESTGGNVGAVEIRVFAPTS